jgi:hypothetical protein
MICKELIPALVRKRYRELDPHKAEREARLNSRPIASGISVRKMQEAEVIVRDGLSVSSRRFLAGVAGFTPDYRSKER